MTENELTDCLRLLRAADDILIANDQFLVAAHLSMAIELLLRRVGEG